MTPVTYAEEQLRVHHEYEEAIALAKHLSGTEEALASVGSNVRRLRSLIEEREYELAIEARVNDPDLSQRAIERIVDQSKYTDEKLRNLRSELAPCIDRQEDIRTQIESLKYTLRVKTARLNSLGGLLNFYAAATMASRKA